MKEDIKAIQEYIKYDKEHRIVTKFDKKPLFRDRLENLLTRYKEDSKLLEYMSKRFEEAIKDTYLLFKLWAVMEKDNISIRTLMEREMSGYYDSKIESEEQKYE